MSVPINRAGATSAAGTSGAQDDPFDLLLPAAQDQPRDGRGARTSQRAQVVSVDNGHCHLYGICEQEAPEVFALAADGRLHYTAHPDAGHAQQVRSAARLCPMQAIELQEKPR